ncbi:VOC family protein [Caulobacter sp.]|uniref:VOC family protein n=1 Tax=Caulobacter sp. TaxID=78 RepID=UPI0016181F98
MLGDKDAQATIGVRDLNVSRPFYEEVLGLKPLPSSEPSVMGFQAGQAQVLVYESEYAGTNKSTVLTWSLGESFDEAVRLLQSKNVAFEHYDLPGMTREGDIHTAGPMKVVWFKDPDGKILSLGNY